MLQLYIEHTGSNAFTCASEMCTRGNIDLLKIGLRPQTRVETVVTYGRVA
jgi:hypothetical protein